MRERALPQAGVDNNVPLDGMMAEETSECQKKVGECTCKADHTTLIFSGKKTAVTLVQGKNGEGNAGRKGQMEKVVTR